MNGPCADSWCGKYKLLRSSVEEGLADGENPCSRTETPRGEEPVSPSRLGFCLLAYQKPSKALR